MPFAKRGLQVLKIFPICDLFFRLTPQLLAASSPKQVSKQADANNIKSILFCGSDKVNLESQEARGFLESIPQNIQTLWAPRLFNDTGMNRLGELSKAGATAFTLTSWDKGLSELRQALEYAATFQRPVLAWPHGNPIECGSIMHEGTLSTEWGINGSTGISESLEVSKLAELSKLTAAHIHVHHLSTKRALDILSSAKADGVNITGGVAPWNLLWDEAHLSAHPFDTHWRFLPPLRSSGDREALIDGVSKGSLCIEPSHLPMPRLNKMQPFELCTPGRDSYGQIQTLIQDQLRDLMDHDALHRALWTHPRQILGLDVEGKSQHNRS